MPQNAQPLLQVSGLTKSYEGKRGSQEQHHALSGVDFTCGEGELVTVIGPSGAGKSTFLRCINRLIEPTEGSVVFNGQDITHLRRNKLRDVRTQIAMIFQNYNLVYRLTAIQNVLHGRLGYKGAVAGSLGLYSEGEKLRAFELLDEVGLGEFAYRRADQLSGGQKQRVGIARALIQDPRIILCDEPIASLDPKSSRAVMEHLRRVTRQHGITCIVNLHQVDMALEFSDRIVACVPARRCLRAYLPSSRPRRLAPFTVMMKRAAFAFRLPSRRIARCPCPSAWRLLLLLEPCDERGGVRCRARWFF